MYWALCSICGDQKVSNPFKPTVPVFFVQDIEPESEEDGIDGLGVGEGAGGEVGLAAEEAVEVGATTHHHSAAANIGFHNIQANAPCVFLIQTIDAEICGVSMKVNVCFDSGAGISSCRMPATLMGNKDIKPIGQRRATLITVAGKKSESFDIFGVTVKTKDYTLAAKRP